MMDSARLQQPASRPLIEPYAQSEATPWYPLISPVSWCRFQPYPSRPDFAQARPALGLSRYRGGHRYLLMYRSACHQPHQRICDHLLRWPRLHSRDSHFSHGHSDMERAFATRDLFLSQPRTRRCGPQRLGSLYNRRCATRALALPSSRRTNSTSRSHRVTRPSLDSRRIPSLVCFTGKHHDDILRSRRAPAQSGRRPVIHADR